VKVSATLTITADTDRPREIEIEVEWGQDPQEQRAFEKAVGRMLLAITQAARTVSIEVDDKEVYRRTVERTPSDEATTSGEAKI
jgi:hypothetical protein